MDAGWYVFRHAWSDTGTWEVDPIRFPHGLRAVSDHAHSKDVKVLLWFEPERVAPGSWLFEHHPEWLLEEKDNRFGQKLLNLGNPEAYNWLVDKLDNFISEQGIDLYRTDFNIDPLPFWRAADAPDRQGITENRYISGFLSYLDELHKRHPNIWMDTCASGGRRNDLETLRRALPLMRSDYGYEPTGMQNLTYGASLWLPYSGTGVSGLDPYAFRSQMTHLLALVWDLRNKSLNYPLLRRMVSEWRQIADLYYGDFYPLLPYEPGNAVWVAWQFDRPDLGQGFVQAFRRPECQYETTRLKLHGLNPAARYEMKDMDTAGTWTESGLELMEKGLAVTLKGQPSAEVLVYKRVTEGK
jgi:alpha-galactosidase